MVKAVKELQDEFADIDFFSRISETQHIELMVKTYERIKVKMYQESNHTLPHLHIDYGPMHHVAAFDIKRGVLIEGDLPRKYLKAVISWIERYRDSLLEFWRRLSKGESTQGIVIGDIQ